MNNPDVKTSSLEGMRINRFFTENGIISRRAADQAVVDGRIMINDKVAKLGDRVLKHDIVSLDGKVIRISKKKPVIIAFNKPVGIECTSNEDVPENIISKVNYPERVFHIGRLDKMSEGLILLTNIGDVVNKILRARNFHEKEYVVKLNCPISDRQIAELSAGMDIDDGKGPTRPCEVRRAGHNTIIMVLTEGRNRQIRRMIELIGLRVSTLRRIRIMNINLGSLPRGTWRNLTAAEEKSLLNEIT